MQLVNDSTVDFAWYTTALQSPSTRNMGIARSDQITSLFRLHGHRVFRRAQHILGNSADAEEAVQEVFVRALGHSNEGRNEREVLAWLYLITTNWCLNQIRDRKKRGAMLEQQLGNAEGAERSVGPRGDDLILVRKLLGSVEERQANAAVLVLLDGMSHAEAAEVLGVSARTVGNLMIRFEEAMSAARGQS